MLVYPHPSHCPSQPLPPARTFAWSSSREDAAASSKDVDARYAGRSPGGGTHEFLTWLTGRRVQYSVGFPINDELQEAILGFPEHEWRPTIDAEGVPREGAWVADVTGLVDLSS